MLINGVDALTMGFTLSDAPGWLDMPPAQTPVGIVLSRGSRALGPPVENAKRLTIRGWVRASTAAQARIYLDTLKLNFFRSPVQLVFADWSTRYYDAMIENFSVPPAQMGSQVAKALQVTATFITQYAQETALTSVSGSDAMPMGTGPVRPIVTLSGATSPVTHSLLDKDGNTISSMVIAASGTIVVDHDAMTIVDDGVLNLNALTSGDFFYIDPAQIRFQGSGPTITSSGASSHSISYRKSWR